VDHGPALSDRGVAVEANVVNSEDTQGQVVDVSSIPASGPAIADTAPASPAAPDPSQSTLTLKVAMADPDPPRSPADIPADQAAPIDTPTVEDLKAQLSELRDLLRSEQRGRVDAETARVAQAEAARREWLTAQGLIKWEYQTLAPGVAEANPYTEEGRRALARFRTENPTLFKGSPEPPPAKPAMADKVGRKTWKDIMGGAYRGLND